MCCCCRCPHNLCPLCGGTGFVWRGCIDGQGHRYPSPWWGIVPPPCEKCGAQPIASGPTVTWHQTVSSGSVSMTVTCAV